VEPTFDERTDEPVVTGRRLPAFLAGPVVGPLALVGCLVLGAGLAVSQVQLQAARQELARSRQVALETQGGLRQCKAGKEAVETALRAQNDAAAAWRRTGGAAVSDAGGRPHERAAVILAREPAGGDACLRAMEADRLIGEFAR
jgi:hypothetical protein